jgi:hypothetical protein
MTDIPDNKSALKTFLFSQRGLLCVGAAVHLLSTVVVYLIGRNHFLPGWILESGTLQEDASRNLASIEVLSTKVANGEPGILLDSAISIDLRIYSVSHAFFSGLTGNNVLSVEGVNLFYYLLIVWLIFLIGKAAFDKTVGLAAGYAAMLMPSFLLHMTQPLRDPLFIALFLLFVFQLVHILVRPLKKNSPLKWITIGLPSFVLLWLVRDRWQIVFLGMIGLGAGFLFLFAFSRIREYKFNFSALICLFVFALLTPFLFTGFMSEKIPVKPEDIARIQRSTNKLKGQEGYLVKVNRLREGFAADYRDAGSNIDIDVRFESGFSLLSYLPRAMSIGMFAPFPNRWISRGEQYGSAGRMLSGIETGIMYVFIALAFAGVIMKRRIPVLFLVSIVIMGSLSLGLVVTNVGAIYRMRYAYWLLIIIAGVGGTLTILRMIRDRKTQSSPAEEAIE